MPWYTSWFHWLASQQARYFFGNGYQSILNWHCMLFGKLFYMLCSHMLSQFYYFHVQRSNGHSRHCSQFTIQVRINCPLKILVRIGHKTYNLFSIPDGKDDSFRYLTRTNDTCEWLWGKYLKIIPVAFFFVCMPVNVISVLTCYSKHGSFDADYVYHGGLLRLVIIFCVGL